MSDEHKQALAQGREHGRVVRAYLAALDQSAEGGSSTAAESIAFELRRIEGRLADGADPLERVHLLQRRNELEREAGAGPPDDALAQLEERFVAVAADYSRRKGLTCWAFRETGVPAEVLSRAGIDRDREHPAVRLAAQRGDASAIAGADDPASRHPTSTPSPELAAARSLTGVLAELLEDEERGS